mmetsp:Transcript_24854/g.36467  ORF Transcript_24854/g.36467 Transcript_24854/m.36467 type:complete len:385 (+) Transcript_24854:129-1283(+)
MPTQSSMSDQAKELYRYVKKQIEDDDAGSTGAVLLVAGGAAVGSVLLGLYCLLAPSERGLKQKIRNANPRLLGQRTSPRTDNNNNNASNCDGDVFDQFRSAYVEDKELLKHTGGCHCGNVRFIVEAPEGLDCIDSDRNMYTLKGRFPHLVVPKSRVVLITSRDHLRVYSFGNVPMGPVQEVFEFQNLFCKNCGVHCFGYNQAKDTMHVNTMCLDMDTVKQVSVAFESERSSWQVMHPLLYQPSVGQVPAMHHPTAPVAGDECLAGFTTSTGTSLPSPWHATNSVYDDLTSLGVAAGALHQTLNQPAKQAPLLAGDDIELGDDSFAKKLFSEDNATADYDDVINTASASPLTKMFSVEKLRRHLKKHVHDDSQMGDSVSPAVSVE